MMPAMQGSEANHAMDEALAHTFRGVSMNGTENWDNT
jgi:hypothetical protein